MIRHAEPMDLEPLCELAKRFAEESRFNVTFDHSIARDILWQGINDHETIMLVWDENGMIAGGIMGFAGHEFSVETVAYITKLFLDKEFRGTGIAHALVRAFEKEVNADIILTSASAGMSPRVEKMYNHMFQKLGYQVQNPVLCKSNL